MWVVREDVSDGYYYAGPRTVPDRTVSWSPRQIIATRFDSYASAVRAVANLQGYMCRVVRLVR